MLSRNQNQDRQISPSYYFKMFYNLTYKFFTGQLYEDVVDVSAAVENFSDRCHSYSVAYEQIMTITHLLHALKNGHPFRMGSRQIALSPLSILFLIGLFAGASAAKDKSEVVEDGLEYSKSLINNVVQNPQFLSALSQNNELGIPFDMVGIEPKYIALLLASKNENEKNKLGLLIQYFRELLFDKENNYEKAKKVFSFFCALEVDLTKVFIAEVIELKLQDKINFLEEIDALLEHITEEKNVIKLLEAKLILISSASPYVLNFIEETARSILHFDNGNELAIATLATTAFLKYEKFFVAQKEKNIRWVSSPELESYFLVVSEYVQKLLQMKIESPESHLAIALYYHAKSADIKVKLDYIAILAKAKKYLNQGLNLARTTKHKMTPLFSWSSSLEASIDKLLSEVKTDLNEKLSNTRASQAPVVTQSSKIFNNPVFDSGPAAGYLGYIIAILSVILAICYQKPFQYFKTKKKKVSARKDRNEVETLGEVRQADKKEEKVVFKIAGIVNTQRKDRNEVETLGEVRQADKKEEKVVFKIAGIVNTQRKDRNEVETLGEVCQADKNEEKAVFKIAGNINTQQGETNSTENSAVKLLILQNRARTLREEFNHIKNELVDPELLAKIERHVTRYDTSRTDQDINPSLIRYIDKIKNMVETIRASLKSAEHRLESVTQEIQNMINPEQVSATATSDIESVFERLVDAYDPQKIKDQWLKLTEAFQQLLIEERDDRHENNCENSNKNKTDSVKKKTTSFANSKAEKSYAKINKQLLAKKNNKKQLAQNNNNWNEHEDPKIEVSVKNSDDIILPTEEKFRQLICTIKPAEDVWNLIIKHHSCLLDKINNTNKNIYPYVLLYHSMRIAELTRHHMHGNKLYNIALYLSVYGINAILTDRTEFFLPDNPEKTVLDLETHPNSFITTHRKIMLDIFDNSITLHVNLQSGFMTTVFYNNFYGKNLPNLKTKLPLPGQLLNVKTVLLSIHSVYDFIAKNLGSKTNEELLSGDIFSNPEFCAAKSALFLLGHFARVLREYHHDFCKRVFQKPIKKNNFSKGFEKILSEIDNNLIFTNCNYRVIDRLGKFRHDQIAHLASNATLSDVLSLCIDARNAIKHTNDDEEEIVEVDVNFIDISPSTVVYMISCFINTKAFERELKGATEKANSNSNSNSNRPSSRRG